MWVVWKRWHGFLKVSLAVYGRSCFRFYDGDEQQKTHVTARDSALTRGVKVWERAAVILLLAEGSVCFVYRKKPVARERKTEND